MLSFSPHAAFGISLLASVLAGAALLRWEIRRRELDAARWEEWLPGISLGALAGARILALLELDWRDLISTEWWRVFSFWDGGLSLLGALAGGLGVLGIQLWRSGQPAESWLGALAGPLFLTVAGGRLGTFWEGRVFFGAPTESFPGIIVDNLLFPLSGIRHHPLSLYDAALAGTLFLAAVLGKKRGGARRFFLLLGIFAAARIFWETLRFDAIDFREGITFGQLEAGALAGISFLLLFFFSKKNVEPESDR